MQLTARTEDHENLKVEVGGLKLTLTPEEARGWIDTLEASIKEIENVRYYKHHGRIEHIYLIESSLPFGEFILVEDAGIFIRFNDLYRKRSDAENNPDATIKDSYP